MTELTIEITNYCPHNCTFCSSNAGTWGKHLGKQKIFNFLNKFDKNKVDRINISGGEPLSHPNFWEILQKCYSITKFVVVYTNAISFIAFNTHVLQEIDITANVCIVPNTSVFIPKPRFRINLLKFISQGRGKRTQEVETHASGNIYHNSKSCVKCDNITLLANGKVAQHPCKKEAID